MMFQENRRLALVLCVFLIAVFLVCSFNVYNIIFPAVLTIFTANCFILRFFNISNDKLNKIKSVCVFLPAVFLPVIAAVFFCILHYNISAKPVLKYMEKYKDTPVLIKAEIKKAESSVFMSSFDLKVYEIDGEKVKKFNLSLTVFGEAGIEAGSDEIGDILETRVLLIDLEDDAANQTSAAYAKSGGYYIAAEYAENNYGSAEPLKITPAERRPLSYYFEAMRIYTQNTFYRNIKFDYNDNRTEEAAMVFGIFTGDKSDIEQPVRNDFTRAGIVHVLSVSGLHLAVLCGIVFTVLDIFRVHKKIKCVVIILFCLFFMAFAGFSVSVVRAGIMTIIFYLAFMFGRKSDSVTSLFIAGTIAVALFGPYISLNIGFQLSFMSTLGIITTANLRENISEKIDNIKRFKFAAKLFKIIILSMVITLAAVIFTLPITSYNFHALSLISPLTNIFIAPLITAILFLALLMMIFSFFEAVLFVFGLPLYYITKLLTLSAQFFSRFKYSYISVESTVTGDVFYIIALIFLITLILCLYINSKLAVFAPASTKNKKNKRIKLSLYSTTAVMFIIMAAVLIYPRILFNDSVRIAYYSDDKNQNIILFNKDYDSADIIDISHGTLSHVGETYNILPQNGAVNINSIILTHYHKRHINMIRRYINYSNINRVYIPAPSSEYDIEVLNALYYLSINKDREFELIKYGDSLDLGGGITITKTMFDYNKMQHLMVNLIYHENFAYKNFLYLGIGYAEGFSNYTNNASNDGYDVVFYGTHKHNRRDDNYISDVYGVFAGVLSSYTDNNKNKATQRLTLHALDKYLENFSDEQNPALFLSDDYNSIVFEVNKTGRIKRYLK